ncbi:lysylphosphatidylglycerol synthase domain-containing protein [Aquabacterium sp.]|uniref:lysylphosphatidylglycerol synthase domain-containing protein n=1 Tax=Aquabacterium sp. TaxID=1872578 RepID=UPI002CD676AF|nr:lysylphosphatidylglycerol synthase domain-containing protein [Aquabacterium sp.]HSW09269.1 lysylphosphatidylglycerol synthase domain-containing protein [Aquabacterium sp.]
MSVASALRKPTRKPVLARRPAQRSHRLATAFSVVFGVAVLGLIAWVARKVEWTQVLSALQALPAGTLAAALGVAMLSHLMYSSYDLIGRAWTGHNLPLHQVMKITFVSYAFNLNLGSMVGAIAMRFRLYSRLGLAHDQIARVLALSLITNWLGYAALAGGVFLLRLLAPPPEWTVSAAALQVFGGVLWLLVAGYLAFCGLSAGRRFTVRGHVFVLPSLRIALLQLVLSCINWLVIAGVLYLLLQRTLPYAQVLPVFLVAVVAGLIVRIPGGLGVLEAVFVALLSPPMAQYTVLAALLAYRAIYYLLPLLVATVMYFVLEAKATKGAKAAR